MDREQIISFLSEDWVRTNDLIRSSLSSDIKLLSHVNEGILSRSGKQLRPMVCLLMARACNKADKLPQDSIRFAAASEILHNATLIHDDVADESLERRGMPTLATLIGPSSAVLVGDFWLSKAVSIVLGADDFQGVEDLFSKTLSDLAEGEMLQLQNASTAATTLDDYLRVIWCKTASLFETACLSGAFSVKATQEQMNAAKAYSSALGTAFQIKDDILDYSGGEALGKPMGIDIKERKITLPLLGAFANCPSREAEMRRLVMEISSKPQNCELIKNFVLVNGGVDYASHVLDSYVQKAVDALEGFAPSYSRDCLEFIARYNSFRKL